MRSPKHLSPTVRMSCWKENHQVMIQVLVILATFSPKPRCDLKTALWKSSKSCHYRISSTYRQFATTPSLYLFKQHNHRLSEAYYCRSRFPESQTISVKQKSYWFLFTDSKTWTCFYLLLFSKANEVFVQEIDLYCSLTLEQHITAKEKKEQKELSLATPSSPQCPPSPNQKSRLLPLCTFPQVACM